MSAGYVPSRVKAIESGQGVVFEIAASPIPLTETRCKRPRLDILENRSAGTAIDNPIPIGHAQFPIESAVALESFNTTTLSLSPSAKHTPPIPGSTPAEDLVCELAAVRLGLETTQALLHTTSTDLHTARAEYGTSRNEIEALWQVRRDNDARILELKEELTRCRTAQRSCEALRAEAVEGLKAENERLKRDREEQCGTAALALARVNGVVEEANKGGSGDAEQMREWEHAVGRTVIKMSRAGMLVSSATLAIYCREGADNSDVGPLVQSDRCT
jgi:hypothetical protein